MSSKKTIKSFSENLPDYLQLDVDGRARGVVDAIDEVLKVFSQTATANAAGMLINGTHASRLEKDLQTLGLESAALSEEERISLSKIRYRLVADSGSLTGVRRLADIYFPGASVQRGRPYPRQKLDSQQELRLGDRRERRQVISVLVDKAAAENRTAEFLANCRRLMPMSTVIEIRVEFADFKPQTTPWRLGGADGSRTQGGRLSCRTSLN